MADEDELLIWDAGDGRNEGEYVRVRGVMDSGSADHVSNRDMAPHVPVKPSAGSRAGKHFTTANGEEVKNEREQALNVITEDGGQSSMVFQITDVKRPLCSVSKICDRGNRVIFGRNGGVIHNLHTNKLTPFARTGSIYTLDFWVHKKAGFARPR